jgi:hypothetical protein
MTMNNSEARSRTNQAEVDEDRIEIFERVPIDEEPGISRAWIIGKPVEVER